MNRPTMLTRAGALAAVLALSLAAGGCADPKKPFRAAKMAFGDDVALVAAHVPLVKGWRTGNGAEDLLARMVAEAAMRRLYRIGMNGQDLELEKGESGSPRMKLAAALKGLVEPCRLEATGPGFVPDDKREDANRRCIEALDGLDAVLSKLDKLAVAEGMPAGTFPRLEVAATPAKRERVAALFLVVQPTEAQKAYSTLVADPGTTFAALDAACQKAVDSRRALQQQGDMDADPLLKISTDLTESHCSMLRAFETNKDALRKCGEPKSLPYCVEPKRCESIAKTVGIPAIYADIVARIKKGCGL